MVYMRLANIVLCVVLAAAAVVYLIGSTDLSGGVLACYLL